MTVSICDGGPPAARSQFINVTVGVMWHSGPLTAWSQFINVTVGEVRELIQVTFSEGTHSGYLYVKHWYTARSN